MILQTLDIKDNCTGIFHNDEFVAEGRVAQLQSAKSEVNEVAQGQECGLKYEGKPVIQEGDVLEVYKEEKIVKKLEN